MGRRVRVAGTMFDSVAAAADAYDITAQAAHRRCRTAKWRGWEFVDPPSPVGSHRSRSACRLLELLSIGPPATSKELERELEAGPGELSSTLAYYRNIGLIDRDIVLREEPGERPAAVALWRAVE